MNPYTLKRLLRRPWLSLLSIILTAAMCFLLCFLTDYLENQQQELETTRLSFEISCVVTTRDIPGDPVLATFTHDEPIFARDTVQHVGQVIGLVVADSALAARRATPWSRKESGRLRECSEPECLNGIFRFSV